MRIASNSLGARGGRSTKCPSTGSSNSSCLRIFEALLKRVFPYGTLLINLHVLLLADKAKGITIPTERNQIGPFLLRHCTKHIIKINKCVMDVDSCASFGCLDV